MSTVIPVPMALIGGVCVLLVAVQLGATGAVAGAVWALATVGIGVGWTWSDRLPNGGGPLAGAAAFYAAAVRLVAEA